MTKTSHQNATGGVDRARHQAGGPGKAARSEHLSGHRKEDAKAGNEPNQNQSRPTPDRRPGGDTAQSDA